MYEKILSNCISLLRGVADFNDALIFSLQLLAWVRLSDLKCIPADLSYGPHQPPSTVQEIEVIFQSLTGKQIPEDNFPAFSRLPESASYIKPVDLLQLFNTIGAYKLTEPCSAVHLADYVAFLYSVRQPGGTGIAQEVANLLVSLAAIETEQEVYSPFEAGWQLAYRARQHTQQVFATSQHHTLLAWLLNILSDTDVKLGIGNELANPLFVQNGYLRQFDRVVAFPTFGLRVSEDFSRTDYYERFPELITSFSVLAIRHIKAATRQRAVIAVPNGVLFSPGAEQTLRAFLLESRAVEGVIALPPALLPGSAVQFSLLVLNTEEPQNEVFFVDGTKSDFYERDGKGRSILRGWEALRDLYFTRQPGPFTCLVTADEVLLNGTNLQPARYCLDAELSATQSLLANYSTVYLREVVQFVRPAAMIEKTGTLLLPEVGVSDFPEFGYLQLAGRTVLTTEQQVAKAEQRKQLLRGHDILVAMKGAVGKVALVDQQFTSTWAASLACLILRVNAEQLDARVLFVFLKSAAGQSLLKRITSAGSTVPLIQLRDLEKLLIPVPTAAEQQLLINSYEQLVALEQNIKLLREQQIGIAESFWIQPPKP